MAKINGAVFGEVVNWEVKLKGVQTLSGEEFISCKSEELVVATLEFSLIYRALYSNYCIVYFEK